MIKVLFKFLSLVLLNLNGQGEIYCRKKVVEREFRHTFTKETGEKTLSENPYLILQPETAISYLLSSNHNHLSPRLLQYRNSSRNTDDSLGSGTKLLLPSLLLGLRHEERETQLFMPTVRPTLNSLTQPTRVRTLQSTNSTGLAQVRKINTLRPASNLYTQLLFKITKNPSPTLPGMTSFTSPVHFPIWGFYCDICDCHILPARAWTPALMCAPTHALSRKVLSLTKPKDKIHKTKNDNIKKISFRNYITCT